MSAVVILPKKKKTFQAAVIEDEPEVFKPPSSSGGNARSYLPANPPKGKDFTVAAVEAEQDPRYTSMTESEQELYKVLIGDSGADVSKIDFSKPEPKNDPKPVPAPEPEAREKPESEKPKPEFPSKADAQEEPKFEPVYYQEPEAIRKPEALPFPAEKEDAKPVPAPPEVPQTLTVTVVSQTDTGRKKEKTGILPELRALVGGVSNFIQNVLNLGGYAEQIAVPVELGQQAATLSLMQTITGKDMQETIDGVTRQAEELTAQGLSPVTDIGTRYQAETEALFLDLTKGRKFFDLVITGTAEMIPTVLSSVALPGSALYLSMANSTGQAMTEALNSGADDSTAVTYGVACGLMEGAVETLTDGMAGIFGKMPIDDYVQDSIRNAVSNPAAQKALITAAGMAGEGFEEFYSEVAHKLLNDGFLASDARTWDEVLGDAGRSALLGAVVSGLVSGVSHLTNPTPQELADYVEDSVRNVGLDTDTDLVSEPVDVNSEKFEVDTGIGEAYNSSEKQNTASDLPYAHSRPSYRKGVVEEVWRRAVAASPDGKVRDPNTYEVIEWEPGQPRSGVWDMGHIKNQKYNVVHKRYLEGKMTTAEFLDWFNDPSNYRPELPHNNRGHKYE